MKNRFIGEGGKFISDISEMNESSNLEIYILAFEIEKTFDSLSYSFLLVFLKNMDMEMTL